MLRFFREQKQRGNIRSSLSETDLSVLCSTLMHGLMGAVGSGMDPAEAKRLWLLGFARLADVRAGRKN